MPYKFDYHKGTMSKQLILNAKTISPKKTLIVVVDLQNDFCHQKNVYNASFSNNRKAARKIHKFVEEAKSFGVDAVYTQQIFNKSKLTQRQKKYYLEDKKHRPACIRGTFGSGFFEANPPKNKVFTKFNFDIWQSKRFENYLEKNKIDTLIITGVDLLCCALHAVLGADERGFNVVVPKDLVSSADNWKKEANSLLKTIGTLYGPVVSSDEIIKVWKKQQKTKRQNKK